MSAATRTWWMALCAAALLNAALWGVSAWWLAPDPEVEATRRALLWLSALYVAGCAFRSALPMIDVPRYCLHDTPVSRIFVGRSVATVAELAFVDAVGAPHARSGGGARGARGGARSSPRRRSCPGSRCSTRNDLFHAAENALWTAGRGVRGGVPCLALALRGRARPARDRRWRRRAPAAYIAFMIAYVVPMYLARWRRGRHVISRSAKGSRRSSSAARSSATGRCGGRTRRGSRPISPSAVWISLALVYVPCAQA